MGALYHFSQVIFFVLTALVLFSILKEQPRFSNRSKK